MVAKQFFTRMSQKKLADIMYAIIMTKASVKSTYGAGIYRYSRSQNAYNGVSVLIMINEAEISKFEDLTGIVLEDPQKVHVN